MWSLLYILLLMHMLSAYAINTLHCKYTNTSCPLKPIRFAWPCSMWCHLFPPFDDPCQKFRPWGKHHQELNPFNRKPVQTLTVWAGYKCTYCMNPSVIDLWGQWSVCPSQGPCFYALGLAIPMTGGIMLSGCTSVCRSRVWKVLSSVQGWTENRNTLGVCTWLASL